MSQQKRIMVQSGFEDDPVRGYERWTHTETGVTAVRQPYMTDLQWEEHLKEKLVEAKEKSK